MENKKELKKRLSLGDKEFDEIVVINSNDKIDLIDKIKQFCDKYTVIDMKYSADIYTSDKVYFYYSVILFYQKKSQGTSSQPGDGNPGPEGEVLENPTKEPPTEIEEVKP